jgi:hypothetical protein
MVSSESVAIGTRRKKYTAVRVVTGVAEQEGFDISEQVDPAHVTDSLRRRRAVSA